MFNAIQAHPPANVPSDTCAHTKRYVPTSVSLVHKQLPGEGRCRNLSAFYSTFPSPVQYPFGVVYQSRSGFFGSPQAHSHIAGLKAHSPDLRLTRTWPDSRLGCPFNFHQVKPVPHQEPDYHQERGGRPRSRRLRRRR